MRVVVALGGNALLKRGEPMTAQNQRQNVRIACQALAPVALEHELVITHGNGPQVGLLALQSMAYTEVEPYPLDVLGAQTEGAIGYLIEQELGNLLPFEKPLATILTMTEVDPHDAAFTNPTKFVGPVYDRETAERLAASKGWMIKPDGEYYRRVVPSPKPLRVFQQEPIEWLLEKDAVVICAGGGGIPTAYAEGTRELHGVEAVIDKDLVSMIVARDLHADILVIATDVDGVYLEWNTPESHRISHIHPDEMERMVFPAGSMGPKVEAAISFARSTGKPAVIGELSRIQDVLAGQSGTLVSTSVQETTFERNAVMVG